MVAQNPCKPAVLVGGIWCCLDVSFPSDIWWEVMKAPLSSILFTLHSSHLPIPHHTHNRMPVTFQWNSWLSFMALEYQTGLGNGSSSRWPKGEEKPLATRNLLSIGHQEEWGTMWSGAGWLGTSHYALGRLWVPEQSGDGMKTMH